MVRYCIAWTLALLVSALLPQSAFAQRGDRGDPFRTGGRIFREPGGTRQPRFLPRGAAPPPAQTLFVQPLFSTGEDFHQYGALLGYTNRSHRDHPWTLLLTYARLEPDGADGLDTWGVGGTYRLTRRREGVPWLTLVTTFRDTVNVAETYEVVLQADHEIGKLTLTGNLGWTLREPDAGGSVSALIPALGAEYVVAQWDRKEDGTARSAFSLAADYTFRNAVFGEDDWAVSGTAYLKEDRYRVILTGSKHGVFTLKLRLATDLK
jgi:hypothetical protein